MRILNCVIIALLLSLQSYAYAETTQGHQHQTVQSADSHQHETGDGDNCKREGGCCCKCCKKSEKTADTQTDKAGKENCCKDCCCKSGSKGDEAESCHRKTSAKEDSYHSAFADYAADSNLNQQH